MDKIKIIFTGKCEGCGKNIRRDNRYSPSRLKRPKFCNSKCANQRDNSSHFKKGCSIGLKTQFKKGNIPWNIGRSAPQISEGLKNKKRQLGNLRRKEAESGEKSYWYGKKRTEEDKVKMRGPRPNFIPWNKGRHFLPIEHYQKIGIESVKKQSLMNGFTSIENKLYDELARRKLFFEKQKLINNKFLVDAYIPSLNLIIEADGNYWHSREDIMKRDKSKNAYLTTCGYNMLRLTETEINQDTKGAIDKIWLI